MTKKKHTKKKGSKKLKPIDPQKQTRHDELIEHEKACIKVREGKDGNLELDLPDGLTKREFDLWLIESLGVKSVNSALKLSQQVTDLESREERRISRTNSRMSAISDLEPQDNVEAMLITQMVAIHDMTMDCSARALNHEQTFEGKELNINASTKLSRSFVNLLSALNKHRGKGQQKMTVEHVTVNEGGQAVVGNIDSCGKPQVFAKQGGNKNNEQ